MAGVVILAHYYIDHNYEKNFLAPIIQVPLHVPIITLANNEGFVSMHAVVQGWWCT